MLGSLAAKASPVRSGRGVACGAASAARAALFVARGAIAFALALLVAFAVNGAYGVAVPQIAYADDVSADQRVTTTAQQPASSSQDGEVSLELYRGHAEDGLPLQVANMLPGDSESRAYVLQVSYEGSVTVKFHADIRDGHDGLADVLMCRVSVRGGEELYDGLMRDMPEALDYALPQSSGSTEEVTYDICVYLDTSVGNEYAEKELVADFRWWVESDSQGGGSGDGDSNAGGGAGSNDGTGGGSQGGLITPPTGDDLPAVLWIGGACVLIAALVLALCARRKKGAAAPTGDVQAAGAAGACCAAAGEALAAAGTPAASSNGAAGKTRRRLLAYAVVAVVLACVLAVVTYALTAASESVDDNSFQTGRVEINLDDGEPVIQAQKFEPGMVVVRDFFVENTGTADAFCKVYFTDVQGVLADVLVVRISDGDDVLFEGAPADLSREAATAFELAVGESRTLTATFSYPSGAGSEGQGEELSFSMSASATQVKNNPTGSFE